MRNRRWALANAMCHTVWCQWYLTDFLGMRLRIKIDEHWPAKCACTTRQQTMGRCAYSDENRKATTGL